jgi:hypothetical protein
VAQYQEFESIKPDVRSYLEKNGCVTLYDRMTLSQIHLVVRLHSQIIFFEKGAEIDKKIRALRRMSNRSYLAFFFLAAIYAKENQLENLKKLLSEMQAIIPLKAKSYEPVFAKFVYPYCQKNNLEICLTRFKDFAIKKKRIWL